MNMQTPHRNPATMTLHCSIHNILQAKTFLLQCESPQAVSSAVLHQRGDDNDAGVFVSPSCLALRLYGCFVLKAHIDFTPVTLMGDF